MPSGPPSRTTRRGGGLDAAVVEEQPQFDRGEQGRAGGAATTADTVWRPQRHARATPATATTSAPPNAVAADLVVERYTFLEGQGVVEFGPHADDGTQKLPTIKARPGEHEAGKPWRPYESERVRAFPEGRRH